MSTEIARTVSIKNNVLISPNEISGHSNHQVLVGVKGG